MTVMFKRFKITLFGLILSVSVFGGFIPHASATETLDADMQRRKLATLKECIGNEHIDENDDVTNFNDFWDGDDGAHYNKEYVVVGFDRDSSNGVQNCKTVIDEGVRVFDPTVSAGPADTQNYFVKKMSGRTDLAGKSEYNPSITQASLKSNRDTWVREIDAKINALGPPKKSFNALRLDGLVRTCYDIKDFEPSFVKEDKDVVVTHRGKQYFYDFKDITIPGYVKQKDGIGPGLPGDNETHLGDIRLNFDDEGAFDGWDNNFYPFGGDQPSFTSGQANNGTILDCKFIKELLESGYFSDDIVLAVRTDGDKLVLDTNGNGVLDANEEAQGTPIDSGDGAAGSKKANGCEFNANPLSWIACPVLGLLREAIRQVDGLIIGYLYTDLNSNEYATGGSFYQSWSIFRYIALSIIVVVAIVMIVAQATAGVFDAYSFKKLLPKLLVAVVLISLSWILCTFFIDIVNTIALNLRSIFYLPFGGERAIENHVFNLGSAELAATNVGLIYGGVAAASLGIMGVLSFAVTAFFAAIIALLVLTFRKILVLLLVITSPIAIACSVLPNTEKVWKLWKETFSKVLIMFPMIMMVIAAGHVVAYTAVRQGGGLGNQIIAFASYIIGYVATITIAKASGAAFSTITGMANNRTKGLFDRQSAYRKKIGGQRQALKDQRNLQRLGDTRRDWRGTVNRARGRTSQGMPISGGIDASRIPGLQKIPVVRNAGNRDFFMVQQAAGAQKAEKDRIDQARLLLDQRVKGLEHSKAVKEIVRTFDEAYARGDETMAQAAISQLSQRKSVKDLSEIQERLLSSGRAQDLSSWADAVGKNYGDFAEMSPSLTATDLTKRADTFSDLNAEAQSKLKLGGWQQWAALDPAAAQASARKVASNDKLRSNLTGDVKRFMSDPAPTFNPAQPFESNRAPGWNIADANKP